MKYLVLIYSNPRGWGHPSFLRVPEAHAMPEAARAEMSAQFEALMNEITESGELIGGEALAAPESTRTVRVRGDVPATTDGPYAEAKEHLAGYFLLDCASFERATELAARFPDARFGAVEVRPIWTGEAGGR
ncbi:YciI family protein [Amycolatopsis anabasis]|uniref:YciI family protein n=1 Tax=Amycolatopsis anabasis TaxID=1840409 RepID=UPI00131D3299|nr:YciI family protein [Amycolatopsis anabasis]